MGKEIPNPVYEIRKVSQWRQPSPFWTHKRQRRCTYQTEKNSYANVIGHHAGQYVTVRAHNSVHAEALGDASASLLPARAQSALQEKSIRYY